MSVPRNVTKRHELQLLLPANTLALVRWVLRYLQRCDGQWSVTVVMRIVTPQSADGRAGATNITDGLNSSLVLHYAGWQGVSVLCGALSPHLHSGLRQGTQVGLWLIGKSRQKKAKVMGRGNKPGLPVSVTLGFCVFVCVVKGCLEGLGPWQVKFFGPPECDQYKTLFWPYDFYYPCTAVGSLRLQPWNLAHLSCRPPADSVFNQT